MRTASSCQPSVARVPQMLPSAQRASADVTADSAGVRARLERPIEGLYSHMLLPKAVICSALSAVVSGRPWLAMGSPSSAASRG